MSALRDLGIDPAGSLWSGETTGDFLVHLNKRLIHLMNERDYENPFFDILSHVYVELHGLIGTGKEDFIYGYKTIADESPNLHAEVTNASATVEEDLNRGTVILYVDISGYRNESMKAATILSTWNRVDMRWSCVSYVPITCSRRKLSYTDSRSVYKILHGLRLSLAHLIVSGLLFTQYHPRPDEIFRIMCRLRPTTV